MLMIEIKPDGIYQDGINLGSVKDASWNQQLLDTFYGIRQKQTDVFTCQRCCHSYEARRSIRFVKGAGLVAEYIPSPDPGCPRGCTG